MVKSAVDVLARAIMTVAPRLTLANLQIWVAVLEPLMRASGITTPNRVAAFLAQGAYESGNFTELEEDLNYSAPRLLEVWPSRFPSLEMAEEYAYQPEKLANLVYAGRGGNGPMESGDAWLFRGRGVFQLTFRENYTRCATSLKMKPEALAAIAATPPMAAATACWFWSDRALNGLADLWEITAITTRVNGGVTTAAERLALALSARAAIIKALAAS